MLDFFEMERVIEELAKAYPAQCATTWFKVTGNLNPSEEEYRDKVVEYMKQFEFLLATYPQGHEKEKLKNIVRSALEREIKRVLDGDNNEVEKRYKHYVATSMWYGSNVDIKEIPKISQSEQTKTTSLKEKNNKENKNKIIEEQPIQIKTENSLLMIKRKRKKKSAY